VTHPYPTVTFGHHRNVSSLRHIFSVQSCRNRRVKKPAILRRDPQNLTEETQVPLQEKDFWQHTLTKRRAISRKKGYSPIPNTQERHETEKSAKVSVSCLSRWNNNGPRGQS